jgi:hypothetical protein
MSDLRARTPIAALLVMALPATMALAQPRPASPGLAERYRSELERLSTWIRAEESRTTRMYVENRQSYMTPTKRGDVTVTTSAALIGIAAEGLRMADSILALDPLGGEVGNAVTYRFHPPWGRRAPAEDSTGIWQLDLVTAAGTEANNEWWSATGQLPRALTLAQTIATSERRRRAALLPASLTTWLGGNLHSYTADDRWPSVYTGLAASTATISNDCLLGNVGACRKVLLFEPASDPLREWYTPVAWRRFVARYRDVREQRTLMDAAVPGGFSACVDAADDSACERIIREYIGLKAWLDPLNSPDGREALLVAATRLPGAPGLKAVTAKPDRGVVASLEAVGGVKLDSLIQAWLAQVRAAEPDRVQLPAPRLLSALSWIVLLGALSLAGSRWKSA